jgi:hypothetical protein
MTFGYPIIMLDLNDTILLHINEIVAFAPQPSHAEAN